MMAGTNTSSRQALLIRLGRDIAQLLPPPEPVGVREPRRPLPLAPAGAVALDIPEDA